MQNAPALEASLADHLIQQLEEIDLPADVRRGAEAIVYNLGESGLLPFPLADVAKGMDDPVSEEVLLRALKVVQGLEPAGVAARDLPECLLLQVEDDDPDAELKRVLIRDHLEDLKRNKVPKVARALDMDVQRLYEVLRTFGHLTTRPGAGFAAGPTRYIRPDVVVDWEEGEYVVRLVNDGLPRVGISGRIRAMLRESRSDPKIREYLKKKIDAAKWLIEAIAQRQNTLERVATEIVRRQRDYLDFGVSHLKPLKMQEVADALGIHVSTVSRAISDKYAQTPRGIVPLKFFFTGGTESEDGAVESRLSVKEKVRDIISGENKKNPLSDDDVADRLNKECGLAIARRTVTKYRKALNIPSSRQRRVWS
jgi:RNA polymerase sigma-54 factor